MFRQIIKNLYQRDHILYSPHYYKIFQKHHTKIEKPSLTKTKKNSSIELIKKYTIYPYIDILEKKFPKTIYLYRAFKIGITQFFTDLKKFLYLRWKIRRDGLHSLTQDEIKLVFIMSNDLNKIIPIIIMSIVPFTNYIIVPLAFYFPHKFLTSHFWSLQDKKNFMLKVYEKRSKYNEALLRCIESESKVIDDPKLLSKFNDIISHLNDGTHPIIDDIIICKKLFSGSPYSLYYIKREHIKELLRIHGMGLFTFRKKYRLFQRGLMIKYWDIAIEREGGVTKLSNDTIQWALLFRGLNPVNMSTNNMEIWLNQWLKLSSQIDKDNISLLLHCPILLAYSYK